MSDDPGSNEPNVGAPHADVGRGDQAARDDGAERSTAVGPDRAVLDRVVDATTAVLLVGASGDELLLPADRLPEDAGDGTWLILDLDTDPPAIVGIDHALTARRAAAVSARMDRIRRTRRGGRFGR